MAYGDKLLAQHNARKKREYPEEVQRNTTSVSRDVLSTPITGEPASPFVNQKKYLATTQERRRRQELSDKARSQSPKWANEMADRYKPSNEPRAEHPRVAWERQQKERRAKSWEKEQENLLKRFSRYSDYSYDPHYKEAALTGAAMPGSKVQFSRKNFDIISEQPNPDRGMKAAYNFLTPDEEMVYNYIRARQGDRAADQYLDDMEELLNQRYGAYKAKQVTDRSGLGYAGSAVLYGIDAGLDKYIQGWRQALSYDRIPTSPTQVGSAIIREDLKDTGPSILGNSLGQVGYDTITTIANQVPNLAMAAFLGTAGVPSAVAEGVGALSMGGSAGGNTYQQTIYNPYTGEGYSPDQARGYAALNGSSEAGLQYVLGGLSGLGGKLTGKTAEAAVRKIRSAAGRVAADIGIHAFGEGLEEYTQEILDPVFRNIMLDENNDFKLFTEEAAYSFLLGFTTAGLIEGGHLSANDVDLGKTGRAIQTSGKSAQLVENALALGPDSAAGKLAQDIKSGAAADSDINRGQLLVDYATEGGNIDFLKEAPKTSGAELLREAANKAAGTDSVEAVLEVPRAKENGVESAQRPHTDTRTDAVRSMDKLTDFFGAEGKKSAMENYTEEQQNNRDYYPGFNAFYKAGLTGRNINDVQGNIPAEIASAAYIAGTMDAANSLEKAYAATKNTVKSAAPGFDAKNSVTKVNKKTSALLDSLGKATGTSIRIGEATGDAGENGWYKNGQIVIASDATNPVEVVAFHEITHRLQELAPRQYKEYRDYAVQTMSSIRGLENIVDEYQESYRRQTGQELSIEEAMDEVSADYTRILVENTETFKQLIRKNRTIAEKLLDSVKDFLEKIKRIFSKEGQDRAALDAYGITRDQLETAAKSWEEALRKGEEMAETIREAPEEDGSEKYSLKETDQTIKRLRELERENERLKERVEKYRRETKVTKVPTTNKAEVKKAAKEIISRYGAELNVDDVSSELQSLYDYIAAQGENFSYTDAQDLAQKIAEDIVSSAVEVDNEAVELAKELRNTPLYITDDIKSNIPDYGEWRKANFGRLTLKNSTDGKTNIDRIYEAYSELWPNLFPDSIVNPADQLLQLSEAAYTAKESAKVNPFSGYAREAALDIRNDILETFFEVPQAAPTMADKAAKKLAMEKIQGKKAVEDTVLAERMAQGRLLAKEKRVGKERLDKLRAEAAERLEKSKNQAKEQHKTSDAKKREKAKARELRGKIFRHTKKLSKKILSPSDNQHIPEQLKTSVAKVLEAINQESKYEVYFGKDGNKRVAPGTEGATPTKRTEAFRELQKKYREIATNDDTAMVIDQDLLGDGAEVGLFDQVVAMKDKLIDEMSVEELKNIWSVIRSVENAIKTINRTVATEKYKEISDWANDFSTGTFGTGDRKDNFLSSAVLDVENPYTFFSHYGKAGMDMYHMLRNAQDKQSVYLTEIADDVHKIVSEEKAKELRNKVLPTITTTSGEEITLTADQAMDLYNLFKREQGQGHILTEGIHQPEVKPKKIKRGTDAIRLSVEDISQIFSNLTEEEIAIADKLQKLTAGRLADMGNEASMKVFGYKKFTGEDYWPIHTSAEATISTAEKSSGNVRSIKNISIAKNTVPHAGNAVDISGAFENFSRHVADMLDYSVWLAPMEDANRVFNFRFRIEGKPTGKTVKGIIEKKGGGKAALDYWKNLMDDIQNGIKLKPDTAAGSLMAKSVGRFKAAAVGGNIRVVVQQPTAFVRANVVISPVSLTAGLFGGVTKGNGWEKAKKYAPIAKIKDIGGFDIGSQFSVDDLLFGSKSGLDKFNDKLSIGAEKADALTWGKIWNACEHEVKRLHPDVKPGTSAFFAQVREVFTEVIDQTQVVDGVLQRSNIMRSRDALVQQSMSFMGEPTMSLNIFLRSYNDFRYSKEKTKRNAALKRMSRALTALVATEVVNAVAQSFVDAMRDDDEGKKYWERFMSAIVGITGEEQSGWEYLNAFLSGNIADNLNPLSKIPFAKDVLSLIEGYDISRTDMEIVSDIIRAAKTGIDSAGGNGVKTRAFAIKELVTASAKAFGIPAANLYRDIWGTLRSAAVEMDNVPMQFEMEKAIYNITNVSNRKRYMDILFRALELGDYESYYHISKEIMEKMPKTSGETIEKAMRSRYQAKKEADKSFAIGPKAEGIIGVKTQIKPEEKFSIEDLSPDQYKVFSERRGSILNQIKGPMERSLTYSKMSRKEKDKVMRSAEKLADDLALVPLSNGKRELYKWEEYADDALQNGVELWEYVLFHNAYESYKGDTKADNVRMWLDSCSTLSDDQRAFLWGTVYSSEW